MKKAPPIYQDHLIEIFGGHDTKEIIGASMTNTGEDGDEIPWSPDGLDELNGIPGFVRGKIKKKTEARCKEFWPRLHPLTKVHAAPGCIDFDLGHGFFLALEL